MTQLLNSQTTAPGLFDLDGDGAAELLTGDDLGRPQRFFRHGQGQAGYWSNTRVFGEQSVPGNPRPALADLDADGDLDLLAGDHAGRLSLLLNQGRAAAADLSGARSVVLDDLGQDAAPALADLDGDDDLDLLVGSASGLAYFRNTGTPQAMLWEPADPSPFDGIAVNGTVAPALGDTDADGDVDLIVLDSDGVRLFRNESFTWTEAPGALDGVDAAMHSASALADLDGDGRAELVLGTHYGSLRLYRNRAAGFEQDIQTTSGISVGNGSAPAFGDLDADGDADLVVGELYGAFAYFENRGTAGYPVLTARASMAGITLPGGGVLRPALADLTGDGHPDLVLGWFNGVLALYSWAAPGRPPVFVPYEGDLGDAASLEHRMPDASPCACDLDRDNDLDVVVGGQEIGAGHGGLLRLFENTGDATTPVLTRRDGVIPDPGIDGSLSPACGDLDADGAPDLVLGGYSGALLLLRNIGGAGELRFGEAEALPDLVPNRLGPLALADVDRDADLDLVLAVHGGRFTLIRNQGTPAAPAWTLEPAPWPGLRLPPNPSPALADLDGDGLPEWVVGNFEAQLRYFEARTR